MRMTRRGCQCEAGNQAEMKVHENAWVVIVSNSLHAPLAARGHLACREVQTKDRRTEDANVHQTQLQLRIPIHHYSCEHNYCADES